MPDPDFIHLRVHSAYSLLEGAIRTKELLELCRRHRMPAVAVTDTNNMFAAMEFATAAAEAGIQPIVGCQLDVDCGGREGVRRPGGARPDRLVLLAQNEAGYRNLVETSSHAFLSGNQNEVSCALDWLSSHGDGLICLSGGPDGPLARLLAAGQDGAARELAERLAGMFPGRFYVELQRHGLDAERLVEDGLVGLAEALDLPLVATNDVYFATPDMHLAHDALLCIAEKTLVAQEDRRRVTENHHFRSGGEMRTLFADLPEAVANTVAVARRCAYMPPRRGPILPPFADDGADEAALLGDLARRGLGERLERHVFDDGAAAASREEAAAPYRERLEYELGVIVDMGFPGYFLIVADFIRWARENGIPVGPGRGSGAGSVASWALGITDLDPLRLGLLFERFLNPERVSMPDFDIDFCQDRRDEVIRYVRGRYGDDRVANIITFGTLQARAVLRDVGRVFGMPYGQVDRICKLVPQNPAQQPTLQEAIDGEPLLREMRANDESVARLIDVALRLEGLYRHASTHAAGVIIADRPLTELVPLYRDQRAPQPATQFSMKSAEAAGLVKFDFLGLKTLTVLDTACRLVAERGGRVDLEDLPLDDAKTYEMLGRGDTVGVFQLESGGMRDMLRQMKPDSFEDIVALVSLYRPGPMDNIPRYIACKHGAEEPDYLHPDLKPVLEETFGVIIYQEQVMEIAKILAGFSLGGADVLRRAMGKKIREEMAAQRQDFVDGAVARGVERGRALHIFDLVDKFAGYGFNKSHGAAYALVAYRTAWLKAHYPVEFIAASMTLDSGSPEKLGVFRQELGKLGIALLPPDVNRSRAEFSVERLESGEHAVRYALGAVKSASRKAMADMVDERDREGPYATVTAFASRLSPEAVTKPQLENLARAGAFDGLDGNRRRFHDAAQGIARFAWSAQAERESGQTGLFDDSPGDLDLHLPECPDWPAMERLEHEYAAVGFYLSAHPLDRYERQLRRLGVTPLAGVGHADDGARLDLAGTATAVHERNSARGDRYAFVRLSDPSDSVEILVPGEVLRERRDLVEAGRHLHAVVGVSEGEGEKRLFARLLRPLEELLAEDRGDVKLVVDNASAFDGIARAMTETDSGRSRLALVVRTGRGKEVELRLPSGIAVTDRFRSAVEHLPGLSEVLEL